MSKPCEYCGTPVDESDYQDDGYRHTDGRCAEYLKAALGAANREASQLRRGLFHFVDCPNRDACSMCNTIVRETLERGP